MINNGSLLSQKLKFDQFVQVMVLSTSNYKNVARCSEDGLNMGKT